MRPCFRAALLLAGVLAAPFTAPLAAHAQRRDPAAQGLIQQFNQATAPISQRNGRQGAPQRGPQPAQPQAQSQPQGQEHRHH